MHPALGFAVEKVLPGLIGTGVGAWLAFWSKRRMDAQDEIKRQKAAANYAIFVVIQQMTELLLIEKQHLAKFRTDEMKDVRWMEIKPLLHFNDVPPLRPDDLSWLLQKADPNLLPRLMVARNKLLAVKGLMEKRTEIKTRVGEHLEKASAGTSNKGSELPIDFIVDHLTQREMFELHQSAEYLLDFNLDAIEYHFVIVDELHCALRSIWPKPKDRFIRPESREDVLKRIGLSLPPLSSQNSDIQS